MRRSASSPFETVTATGLAEALRNGTISAVSTMESCLAAIEALNPQLNAFVHVDADAALDAARAADRARESGAKSGALHGVPVAVKDNIDVAGMPATYGSAFFATHRPERDAACVRRLREAGAIIVGKTLTHEFAYGPTGDRSLHGAAHNPRDLARMTGGSSAGSAAAVAAGLVPLALGTDTGGSVRIPSALCGAVGFKPGMDVVSVEGVFPLALSLDHVGPIARSVADAALLFSVLREHAPEQKRGKKPRIGWIDPRAFGPVDARVLDTVRAFAQTRFDAAGIAIENETHAGTLAARLQASLTAIQRAEAYDIHAERMRDSPHIFDAEVRARLELSAATPGWQVVRGQREQRALRRDIAACFEHFDFLAMPTLPIVAPEIDQREIVIDGQRSEVRSALLSLTSPWNVTGLPALSVPAGLVDGLPVGLQIIGPAGSDDALLDTMRAVFDR